jgi:hypothetical protein
MAPSGAGRGRALLILTCVLPVALWGCGGATKSSSICKTGAQQFVAHTLGLTTNRVTTVASKGNNLMPQCSFRARSAEGRRLDVTVNVDTSPQPYMVLARTIEERSQGFTPTSVLAAPVAVMGLGLEASWFPDESALMSTDGVRLVTVTLRGSRAKRTAKIRFATNISRLYLRASKPSLAKRSP